MRSILPVLLNLLLLMARANVAPNALDRFLRAARFGAAFALRRGDEQVPIGSELYIPVGRYEIKVKETRKVAEVDASKEPKIGVLEKADLPVPHIQCYRE